MPPMALCLACKRVTVSNLTRELGKVPDWWNEHNSQSKPRGMIHLHHASQLPVSAAGGCPLCSMIIEAILQYTTNPSSLPDTMPPQSHSKREIAPFKHHLTNSPIYLRLNYDPRKAAFPEEDVVGAWHIRGFKAFVPVDHGVLVGQIRLFAPPDSPAAVSCDVVGRPALSSLNSPEAFALMHRWMRACLCKHRTCKETFSGLVVDESSPPILPTRVLHVGRPDEAIYPRLIESEGKCGYYIALSHCWGTQAHKRPLMTTQSTLKSHLAGIAWDIIPRVYQDAITTTHRLGIEFLWIDSLCIIQDSHSDWFHESIRMGNVYENARLTIAASHASHSGESCFSTRSKPPTPIELPYISRTGEYEGSIFASLMPKDYVSISPEDGPLATRAWATQEWLLSRRMVFYTAECLVWSCKMISQRETGASFHSTARNPRWKNIVEKYSARLLTMPTDRLIALEGLRNEMCKKRENDIYCFGLWKNSMPDQLLWYCREPAERAKSCLDLPTWTWASTMHGVRFLEIKNAKNACHGFRFDGDGKTLTIRGAMRVATIKPFTVLPEKIDGTPNDLSTLIGAPPDSLPSYMIHSLLAHDGPILGWAVLDEGRAIGTSMHCLRMMNKRVSLTSQDGSKRKFFYELVLLLRESDNRSTYRRVGVGVLTTTSPWFDTQSLTTTSIK